MIVVEQNSYASSPLSMIRRSILVLALIPHAAANKDDIIVPQPGIAFLRIQTTTMLLLKAAH